MPVIVNPHNIVESDNPQHYKYSISPPLRKGRHTDHHSQKKPLTPNSTRILLTSPNLISPDAMQHIIAQATCPVNVNYWAPAKLTTLTTSNLVMSSDTGIEHFCAGVVHPETGKTITSYMRLIADLSTYKYKIWTRAFNKEFGNVVSLPHTTQRLSPIGSSRQCVAGRDPRAPANKIEIN